MFQTGEKVYHFTYGVCDIIDIRNERFMGNVRNYYHLHPLSDNSNAVIYIPVESDKPQIRELYNRDQIDKIIMQSKNESIDWIINNNYRKAAFLNILKSGNTSKMIAMICCIRKKKEILKEIGKKTQTSDEKILIEAQNKICQEFSYSLNITEMEVGHYIESRI